MMSKFRLMQLDSLVKRVKVGFVGQINEYYCPKEEGVPLIRTTDLNELGIDYSNLKYVTKLFHAKNKKSQIKKGDILIARHGDNGKANVFNENIEAQVLNAVIIEPNLAILNSNLIKFFFDTPFVKKQIGGCVKGSVQGVINTSHISELLIPICDELNYIKIEHLLSAFDAKIALNNRINAELEVMAKTLYDYWFVQFDFPNEENKPYKTSGGAMVWDEDLKREIPVGWEVQDLSNVIEIKYGKDHKKLDFGLIPVFGSGGIMRYVDKAIYDKESILIPRKGTLTNLFYMNKPFWSVDTMFFSKMKIANIGKYLYYFLQSLNLASLNAGTAVPSLTTEILNQLKIVTPAPNIIKRFDTILTPIFEMKEQLTKENQQLSSLRDWLLPMLMNGQVVVE